ncbi:MAG TPA: chorismate synthase, partial [Acidobacteriota bacterium]|nr:chorismate synthase [Acidobacteriota bacterium]
TIGDPISFSIKNRDWPNWEIPMSTGLVPGKADIRAVTRPRPGHADLAGAIKYRTHDVRDILERASARETASRVAAGAFCLVFLDYFGIRVKSHVIAVGGESISSEYLNLSIEELCALESGSDMGCLDPIAEKRMISAVGSAMNAGDTVGGVVEVVAGPVPPGLGSHIQWDRKLDGRIAQALMSIPSAKAVEIGRGIEGARSLGSGVHDEIYFNPEERSFFRKTNRAGGIEGGISNGEDIRATVYLKPVPTLSRPLSSVDIITKTPFEAAVERGDTCVVSAAGVIAEAMTGMVLADSFMEKFGGDAMEEVRERYDGYLRYLKEY